MKKYIIIIIAFFAVSNLNSQQYYYTFTELNGMEDNSGNTHLFYRLYTFQKGTLPFSDYFENSIHHLDISNNIDSLFLRDGQDFSYNNTGVLDIEFWNNDPSKYIYCGFDAVLDPVAFIKRFDEDESSFINLGVIENIELSKQNDSMLFASYQWNLKSTDGGKSWFQFNFSHGSLLSLNPYNDDIFAADYDDLYKSTDGGLNFTIVDTSNYFNSKFFYDKDSLHIYSISYNKLKVSDNKGNAFSWNNKYAGDKQLFLSVDYSQSGSFYLADGRFIYHSNNYGETSNLFKEFDRKLVGIYKKPDSEILYAATKYKLYKMRGNDTSVIKSLPIDTSLLEYFPLAVGNRWIYNETVTNFDVSPFPIVTQRNWTKEIIGKTIKENGKEYFLYSYTNYYPYYYTENFERIDSLNGIIYRYTEDTLNYPDREYEVIDLLAEIEDTVNSYYYGKASFIYDDDFTRWNISSHYRTFQEFESLAGYHYNINKKFGIDSIIYGFDFGNSVSYLKGVVINGIVYGDTTLVGINDFEKNLPNDFALFQNYPNPFNPTTKIKYTIPSSLPLLAKERAGVRSVTLKIYDILGNEIAMLVNKEQAPGEYQVEFDTVKYNLSSGIYFYKLQVYQPGLAGNHSAIKKMIYLK